MPIFGTALAKRQIQLRDALGLAVGFFEIVGLKGASVANQPPRPPLALRSLRGA